MSKLCFLFGHRDTSSSILPSLEQAIEEYHLRYGIEEFVVGNHGFFDSYSAQAVRAVQKSHPSIRLTLLLSYHPAEQNSDLSASYDSTLYPDGMENVPRRFAILRANRFMIDHADAFICCVSHIGNTRDLLALAEKRAKREQLPLINLGHRAS